MAKLTFPKDFMWGGATAAEQHEGHGDIYKGKTKWDLHFEKNPEDFFDKIGPKVTSDFMNNWKSDIKMWKDVVGINSVRLGFSWARLFPDGEKLNQEAVKFYHDVLKELNDNNIKTVMTLFHFDMPAWAIEIGGWSNMKVVNAFEKFSEFVYDEYDGEAAMFATMNEPIVPIFAGYLGQGKHWPMVYDPQLAFDAGNRMILAHAKSVNVFNSKKRKSQIGVVINVSPTHARNEQDKDDVISAKKFHLIHNAWMLDPMIKGTFPAGLEDVFAELGAHKFILTNEELEEIKRVRIDFVGTNFYFPTRLKKYEGEDVKYEIEKIATPWQDPKARMNVHRGWEIYPQDIYATAKLIQEEYNNLPFFISENGMGVENESRFRGDDGEINDDYRIAFVSEHLEYVHKAIQEGANLIGYHMWAIYDCWSWVNAYKNRYGFIEIDLETQKRIPKKSAHWFKGVVENQGFEDNYTKLDELKN